MEVVRTVVSTKKVRSHVLVTWDTSIPLMEVDVKVNPDVLFLLVLSKQLIILLLANIYCISSLFLSFLNCQMKFVKNKINDFWLLGFPSGALLPSRTPTTTYR